jgi:hypothetical protein
MMQGRCMRVRVAAVLVATMAFAASARAATIALDSDGLRNVDNLQQIALALHNYHDTFGTFPTNYVDSGGTALLSWRVALLPFLGQQLLFDQFDVTKAWNDPDNMPLLQLMPDVYRSPASPTASSDTDYAGGSGPDTMFDGSSGVELGSVTDGTSNTLLVGEVLGSSIPWTKPADVPIDSCPTLQGSGFSSFIPGAVPFAFVDGSVRLLPDDLDCATLRSLFLRNDGIADTSRVLDYVAAPVPEPAVLALLGCGAALLPLRRRRRSAAVTR